MFSLIVFSVCTCLLLCLCIGGWCICCHLSSVCCYTYSVCESVATCNLYVYLVLPILSPVLSFAAYILLHSASYVPVLFSLILGLFID